MGAGSSANKGVASRSRFSSWGSSIDEAICGENALCGDYPDDDVEGFPLFSQAPSRRASIVTNPYIEATPRQPPKLRRAFSEGEASVRRAYTTDYSDGDGPDTEDDYPQQPNMIRKSRSALMLHNGIDGDDFPNHPIPLPIATTRYDSDLPLRSRTKRRRKKAPNRVPQNDRRRPFSPSQLQNLPPQKLSKKKNRRSSMPRPESDYHPRRYSMPETIPITSHSRRYSAFETDKDPYGNVQSPPLYSQPTKIKPKKPKKKAKSTSNVPKTDEDEWLADYHLPSQVPSDTYRKPSKNYDSYYSAPLKPITKTRQYDKEPNYKVPTSKPRTRKRSQPKISTKKIPSYPTPLYSGLPTEYESVLQAAPPIRKGARIKAPMGQTSNIIPTPFVVGKAKPPKTPYLASNDEIGYNYI